jgi:hypothetical protein
MERARLKREVLLNPDAALAPSVKGETVGKWFPIIAKDLWGGKASEDPNLRNIVRTWIAYLGPNMPLKDIRTSHVERYVMVKRSEGKANSTINQFTTRLNKMLKKARRLDLIHMLPEIVSAGRGGKRQRWFTDAEIERLTSAFPPYYQ